VRIRKRTEAIVKSLLNEEEASPEDETHVDFGKSGVRFVRGPFLESLRGVRVTVLGSRRNGYLCSP
jgi:hypothetical protein